MTLIVSLSGTQATVMASDRLVTLAHSITGSYLRDYDRMSNKMVVLVMRDAFVSIGYTGTAFIGGKPTDDWIAEVASPGANLLGGNSRPMWGLKVPNTLRLHQLCNRLRLGLVSNGIGRSTAIHIAGWRLDGRRLIPVSIVLRACSPLIAEPETRLRSRREPNITTFGHVGANLTQTEIEAGFQSIAGRPFNVELAREMLTNIIRAKAAVDRSVGSNVMSIIIHHPIFRRINGRFDPLHSHHAGQTIAGQYTRQVVGFSPWVLLPHSFVAPTETSGSGFGTWESDGWTVDISDVTRGPPIPSMVHWSRAQPRGAPLR